MRNCYYDLFVKIKLLENVHYKDLNSFLSNLINNSFLEDSKLKAMHKEKHIKGYVFSSLYPLEKDKLYKRDKEYFFNINSYDFVLLDRMRNCLKSKEFIIDVNMRVKEFKPIESLTSVTPCITSLENARYWTKNDSLKELVKRINNNAKHKAINLFNVNKDEFSKNDNFIESIEIRNKSNIVINYKNSKLICYNVKINIRKDEMSQFLANVCLSSGLGEKNSLGFGFCKEIEER